MPSPEDITNQRALLATYRRRLADRSKQLAGFGDLHAPPEMFEDMSEARREIARISDVLRGWGEEVEALPDDVDPQDVAARRLRLFISYKHHGALDAPLASELAAALRDICDVFIDTELPIGARWAEQIKVELARSDLLIALMSARAAESEMVREELAFAQMLNQAQNRPRILPVRIAYRTPFPYPLNEYLDALH